MSGYPAQRPIAAISQVTGLQGALRKWETDLFYTISSYPWITGAVASGTIPAGSGSENHPGVVTFTSSTSANSGYLYRTNTSAFALGAGGESMDIIFRVISAGASTLVAYLGLHSSTTVTSPSTGTWLDIAGLVLTGKTKNTGGEYTTGTSYTMAHSTWYRARVSIGTTTATFTLFAEDGSTLWTDSLTSGVPTPAGSVGSVVVAVSTGTTAVALLDIDYMSLTIDRELVR